MDVELRHLRYFTAAVECGSLTAAAARLHLSQPPLSVAIAQLEREVGVPLLVRTSRGVEPTSAGRHLLDASSRILGEVEDVLAALARHGAGTAGALTLAAVPTLLWHRVPGLLAGFAREAPDVEVTVVDPPPWTAIDLLQRRGVDAAAVMVADPEGFAARHRGTLDALDWGPVPLVAALPPGEGQAPDPLPLSALGGRTLLLPRRTAAVPSLPEAVLAALDAADVAPAAVRQAETIQTSIPIIESGAAAGILPDPDRATLERFDLTVRRLEPEPTPLGALVLTRAGEPAPVVRHLLSHISAANANPVR